MHARYVLECTDDALPSFEQLERDRPHWLETVEFTLEGVCSGEYCDRFLVLNSCCTHATGHALLRKELAAIKSLLRERPDIEFIFCDFRRDVFPGEPSYTAPARLFLLLI